MIQFSCSNCGNAMSAPYSAGGASGQCPTCGTVVAVPLPVWDDQSVVEREKQSALPTLEHDVEEFPRFDQTTTTLPTKKKPAFLQKQVSGCGTIAAVVITPLVVIVVSAFFADPASIQNQGPRGNANNTPQNTPTIDGSQPKHDSAIKGYVTVDGYLASPSEEDLGKAIRYLVDKDDDALATILASGSVFKLKSGILVSIVETKVLSGKVKIRPRGQTLEFWTNTEAIKRVNITQNDDANEPPASSKAVPTSLLGRWRSPTTGDVFRLDAIRDNLTVEVVASRTLKSGIGTLTWDRSKSFWSGSFAAVFSQDVRNVPRDTGMALTILNSDEVEILADVITWDRNGRETSRAARTMRLRRVK